MSDNNWIGTTDGNLATGTNWSLGHTPTGSEVGVIDLASQDIIHLPTACGSAKTFPGVILKNCGEITIDLTNLTLTGNLTIQERDQPNDFDDIVITTEGQVVQTDADIVLTTVNSRANIDGFIVRTNPEPKRVHPLNI